MQHAIPTAALLLGLVPAGLAQLGSKERTRAVPPARVTYVEAAMSYEPGQVEIRGTNLELISTARINGVELPILANDGQRIVVEPPNQDPGYGVLELAHPGQSLSEPIAFLPALSGRWQGQNVQLRLHPGEPGWYVLRYSFRRLATPLAYPETYYWEMLDMSSPFSETLFAGPLNGGEPIVFPWMPVPRGLSGTGGLGGLAPMRVQALCLLGGEMCFSNMLTLQPTL
jgi:hypothetical protein